MKRYGSFTDAELLRLSADKDELAFAELYGRYERAVYNLALYRTGNREDALDASQDAFLKLWRGAGTYRDGSPSAFILTVAKNAVTDLLRQREKTVLPLTFTDGAGEEAELPIADTADTPAEAAIRQETVEVVREGIRALPDRYREALILCDMEGKSYAEAAAALDVDIGTVKSRLSRGRKKLREFLKNGNKIDGFAVNNDVNPEQRGEGGP